MNENKKKKASILRPFVQAAFFALTNGYAQGFVTGKLYKGANKRYCVPGLNCYSCPGALFACPIGALQATLNSRQFSISCYAFGFLMMVGAFFGRFICGWLCPFGFVQDLLHKIPFPGKRKNLPGHKYLTKLKYAVLIVLVFLLPSIVKDVTGLGQPWFCEYICPSGTLFAGMPMLILNPELRTAIGPQFFRKLGVLIVILLLSIKYYRPFCKYLCPLGAFYSIFNPVSFYRFNVDRDKCIGCSACQNACGMDIEVWKHPNDTECIRCGKCINACPQSALTSSFEELKRHISVAVTVDTSAVPDKKVGVNAPKLIIGMLSVITNIILIFIMLYVFSIDIYGEISGGGATWAGLFKNSLYWIALFASVAVSTAASGMLCVSISRPVQGASAVRLQLYSFIIFLIGLVLLAVRFSYISLMLLVVMIPAQIIITLLIYAAGHKDTEYVKETLGNNNV